jgi:hypothetical protein
MKRRAFVAACCSSLAMLVLCASPAAADRWEFHIRKQNGHKEKVVIHAPNRLTAEKRLRNDHPDCVVLDVKRTDK